MTILLNLLPCPYCSESAQLKPIRPELTGPWHVIKCMSCGATGPIAKSVPDAAAKYNRRPYREAVKASQQAREMNKLFNPEVNA